MVEHTLAKYTVIQPKMPTTAANLMVCDKCEWKWYHEDENEQPRELSRPEVELLHHFASKHVCHICPDASICDLRSLGRPASLPSAHFDTFVLLCCWQLWKRRNGIVFRQEDMPLAHLLQMCKLEARAWSCRLPRDDAVVSDQWCSVFSLAM